MESSQPPERYPADPPPRRSVTEPDQPPSLPPYSARWATGGRLMIVAIILLLIAAVFAKVASRSTAGPPAASPVRGNAPAEGPSIR